MKNNLLVFYISDKIYINTYVEMTMKNYVFELKQKDKVQDLLNEFDTYVFLNKSQILNLYKEFQEVNYLLKYYVDMEQVIMGKTVYKSLISLNSFELDKTFNYFKEIVSYKYNIEIGFTDKVTKIDFILSNILDEYRLADITLLCEELPVFKVEDNLDYVFTRGSYAGHKVLDLVKRKEEPLVKYFLKQHYEMV